MGWGAHFLKLAAEHFLLLGDEPKLHGEPIYDLDMSHTLRGIVQLSIRWKWNQFSWKVNISGIGLWPLRRLLVLKNDWSLVVSFKVPAMSVFEVDLPGQESKQTPHWVWSLWSAVEWLEAVAVEWSLIDALLQSHPPTHTHTHTHTQIYNHTQLHTNTPTHTHSHSLPDSFCT